MKGISSTCEENAVGHVCDFYPAAVKLDGLLHRLNLIINDVPRYDYVSADDVEDIIRVASRAKEKTVDLAKRYLGVVLTGRGFGDCLYDAWSGLGDDAKKVEALQERTLGLFNRVDEPFKKAVGELLNDVRRLKLLLDEFTDKDQARHDE